MSKNNQIQILSFIGVIAILAGIISLFMVFSAKSIVEEKIESYKEASRSADIQVILLSSNVCTGCTDANALLSDVRSANVNIQSEKRVTVNDGEAKEIIDKYSIDRLPSIIITGEISRLSLNGYQERRGALILEQGKPPYYNVLSGKIEGLVSATMIKDSTCTYCIDLKQAILQLEALGVFVSARNEVERSSLEAQALIKEYGIARIPALLISPEIKEYGAAIDAAILSAGEKKSDGAIVIQIPNAPYVDAITGALRGVVTMTVLKDSRCSECYDTESFNRPILGRMGLVPVEVLTFDIASQDGKGLLEKYGIEHLPTFILSKEAEEYAAFTSAWAGVGTIESDGSYVFRKVDLPGKPYSSAATGEEINPSKGQQ